MKTIKLVATALITVMAVMPVRTADVSGKWKADFETPDGQKAHNVFTLKVDGEKVSGTVYSSFSQNEAKIEEGTIKGDQITFAITRNFGGTDVKLKYVGKIAGDEIQFVVTSDGGEFKIEMTAKREKQ